MTTTDPQTASPPHAPAPTVRTGELQRTVASVASMTGRGLFSGQPVQVTFHPAPDNHGIVFVRKDVANTRIPAVVANVVKRARRTTLKVGEASIDTCEHCLSAIAGLAIDNLLVEVEGPELPGVDGSAKPYVDALMQAGVQQTQAPRTRFVVEEAVLERQGDALVAALPCDEPHMEVVYDLDYPSTPIGRQLKVFAFGPTRPTSEYVEQVSTARTFVLESEARAMRAAGIGTHLTSDDVLVIGNNGPIGGNHYRFPDEPVRHKILDLIGDLYLLGAPIQGKIIAYKSGHALNHALVRQLLRRLDSQRRGDLAVKSNVIDIRRLSRILPHRYPMLLVDRVLELEGNRRAVGIKNVTINEPFFQGHYPGVPMMPGVLIVEAMAQLSGVLIGQSLEHTGKLAVLLSLDKVKLRRPVTPGDQLIMEAQAVRLRSRIAHVRCRAYVGSELAAEAEVKFMLVDDQQE